MKKFQSISPDDRGGHFAAKAEGDSDPALSRLEAGERLHMERMLRHALYWIAKNVASTASEPEGEAR